jgi:hypothetical protein
MEAKSRSDKPGSPIWCAGMYLRVSIKGQKIDNQLLQMQRFIEAQQVGAA